MKSRSKQSVRPLIPEFKIKLAPGRYIASRFDPATGEGASLGTVDGGERVIPLPAKHEWVVRLTRVP